MSTRALRYAVTVVCALAVCAVAASKEEAAKTYADGKALLAKGDFQGAQKAFAAAAKADTENQEYRQQYAVLRRVMQMRDGLDKEKNPEKWQATANALRAFYHQNKILTEALALDQKVYDRLKTPQAAAALAGTQLVMGLNADAIKTLSSLDEKAATPETQITLGIALAREKRTDEAKSLAAKIRLPDDAGPGLVYDMACLKALLGESAEANALLSRAFENTPPSRLDGMKSHAKEDKDLASLASSEGFAKALKTESKVKESKCSGGSDCGSCPSKGGCGSKGTAEKCESEKK